MVRTRVAALSFVLFTRALFLPPALLAQQTSSIAGVVKDTSGGVLPGVTVEAASPALIEKVRSVSTDGEGRYNIVDLRPGVYTVTFTLTGFNTFKREGIALTSGFTATVNADMQVGALEETVTVSGESPLVDTQNVRKQTVLSNEVLDALPTSTKHVNTLVTLTPGFTGIAEVNGRYTSQVGTTYHGKSGTKVDFDGMGIENMQGTGNSSYQINSAIVEEMVLQTSGISAESSADGAVVNVIPKEGGNSFRFIANAVYTNDRLESSNLTEKLRSRGFTTVNKTSKIFDEGISAGGPIKKDKVWFFGAFRTWGFRREIGGVFWNKTQGTPFYTPDLSRPADRWEWYDSNIARVTWQISAKHKVNFIGDGQEACNCGTNSAETAPEAAGSYRFNPNYLFQAAWSSPMTSRLLLEGGAAATISHWHRFWMPGVLPEHIRIVDQGLGITYGAANNYIGHPNDSDRYAQRFAVSYVTGTHALKTGFSLEQGVRNTYTRNNRELSYTFRNTVPVSITQYSTPYLEKDRIKAELGIYAQDQWAIKRLTLNLGLRFDYFNGYVPPQQTPGTTSGWAGAGRVNPWLPDRSFPEAKGVPLWKDLNPRVGAAYDLFGDGRTALKASLGRYVRKTSVDITIENNPLVTSVNSVTRAWNDTNRNYVPDCDLGNFAANGECDAISNQNFGARDITTRWADDALRGFGVREFNWDTAMEVQHQIGRGMSVTAGYYRNWYGNLRVTDNLLVTPEDFDPYCITAPTDSRLPGGGGYQVCGLYDIKSNKYGQVNSLITQASNYGKQVRVNDFFNVTFDARVGRGARLGGGVDTGRTVNDRCFAVDAPGVFGYTTAANAPSHVSTTINGRRTCRIVTPFKGQTQIKLNGSYPLPGDFVVSAVYQNISGPAYEANYAATTAEIAPSLGRNLAGGVRTATVALIVPQTVFESRTSRLDLRLTKMLNLPHKMRLQANVDAYNLMNTSDILQLTPTYGLRWGQPNLIVDGRIIQFSGQLTF